MKRFFVLICFIWGYQCTGQSFDYQEIPDKMIDITSNKRKRFYLNQIDNKVESFLPKDHVKDGSVDYTKYIQKALNASGNVLMPNFPILINENGLDIKSNTTLYFQKESKITLKPSVKGSYQMLRIYNVENVDLVAPHIVGDRENHKGNTGEWGMGISIKGAKNVTIVGGQVNNCWGDGIYIAYRKRNSENIQISNSIIDNNRRNGLSVISAKGLKVKNSIFANSNGTNPQTGIDIEPNNSKDQLIDIKFKNNITYNNLKNGFLIHLNKLPGTRKKMVKIKIKNHLEVKSGRPIRISGKFDGDRDKKIPLRGHIKLKDFNTKGNKYEKAINRNSFFPSIKLSGIE